MLGKVKLYFGIEGLKLDLDIPDSFSKEDKYLTGVLTLHSKSPQQLKRLVVTLKEVYHRGRGKDQRTNEYEWGKIEFTDILSIPANGKKIIDFRLPIKHQYSKVDEFGNRSAIFKKISSLAKMINKTKSEHFVEVAAHVEGTALNPSMKKPIRFI